MLRFLLPFEKDGLKSDVVMMDREVFFVGLRFAQRQPTISEFYSGNTFDSLVDSLMRGGEI